MPGMFVHRFDRGRILTSSWPRRRGAPTSPVTQQQNNLFGVLIRAYKEAPAITITAAHLLAQGTSDTYRDVISRAAVGSLIEWEGQELPALQLVLDSITNVPGSMLFRNDDEWVALDPGSDGYVIAYDVATRRPHWVPAASGITAIFSIDPVDAATVGTETVISLRDIADKTLLGNTSGASAVPRDIDISVALDYQAGSTRGGLMMRGSAGWSMRAPGTAGYILTSNGIGFDPTYQAAPAGGLNQLTGDVTAGPGTGSQVATLAASGVAAGSYTRPTLTVDAKGRVTSISTGADPGAGSGASQHTIASATGTINKAGTVYTTRAVTSWALQGANTARRFDLSFIINTLATDEAGLMLYNNLGQGYAMIFQNDGNCAVYSFTSAGQTVIGAFNNGGGGGGGLRPGGQVTSYFWQVDATGGFDMALRYLGFFGYWTQRGNSTFRLNVNSWSLFFAYRGSPTLGALWETDIYAHPYQS